MGFVCTSKRSDLDRKGGGITRTIVLERRISQSTDDLAGLEICDGELELETKDEETADLYKEGNTYVLVLESYHGLGGVFSRAERDERERRHDEAAMADQLQEEMTGKKLADYIAQTARATHEQEPELDLDSLVCKVRETVWPVNGTPEENAGLIAKVRPHVLRALAGIREDAFAALIEMETAAVLSEPADEASQLSDDELFAKILAAVSVYGRRSESAQDEFEARVRPLVEQAKDRYHAEQFRQAVHERAEELLAGVDPRPEIDNLVETLLADGDLFPDEPSEEKRVEVRMEIEMLYAKLDAVTAGEESDLGEEGREGGQGETGEGQEDGGNGTSEEAD